MRGRTKVSRDARRRTYMREFNKNIAFYELHKSELLKKYRNKFIVIAKQNVVDADKDRVALIDRSYESMADEPWFFTEVLVKPRVYRVPSIDMFRKRRTAQQ